MSKLYGEESFLVGVNPHKTFPQSAVTEATDHWYLMATKIFRPMPTDETIESPRVRGHLQPDYRDVKSTRKGVPQPFSFESFDPTAGDLCMLLGNFFQKYTQSDGGDPPPYYETFEVPSDQIDFDGDNGYLLHWAGYHPTADKSFIVSDGVLTDITITISPDGEKQRLNVGGNGLARFVSKNDTPNNWGTPAYTSQNYISYYDLEGTNSYVKIDTVAMSMHSCELHMTNNAQSAGAKDSAGRPQEYKIGPFTGDGTLVLFRDTNSDAVIDDWANGEQVLLDILFQTGAAFGIAGDAQFKHHLQIAQAVPDFGPAGEEVWSIPFKMVKGASNDMAWIKVSTQESMSILYA